MDYETMENHIIRDDFESFSRDFRPNDALIVDSEGNNLLHSCGRFGVKDMRILETLLRHIDPNLSDNDGWTPLIYASYNGEEEVVKILLNNPKVDPNLADNDGWTPLICASFKGKEEVKLSRYFSTIPQQSKGRSQSCRQRWMDSTHSCI
eukprot:TRINITY_DN1056_c1_g1_i3.p1 TRINITY_DN1056_c1_g1~~TRINITY_DN1056_c1_g1_i3.p1  ORF type:complete len:150 (+),score=34.96 TRINITY_DN1056_c1_g1_i3:120-569(+)